MPTLILTLLRYVCFIFTLLFSIVTTAETTSGNKLSCKAEHLDTNKPVEVNIVSGYVGFQVATAEWPLGYPTIIIDDSEYLRLPEKARQFIYYHECAHLKLKTEDEHEADCASIKMLRNKHNYKDIDIRKLIETLVKKFGMSTRWSKLLSCAGLAS